MDFKEHLESAWNLTLKFIGPLILMTLVLGVVSFVTLGILAPVTMAGYFYSILLIVREGREPKIGDIFSEMRLFFPLLGFGILFFIAVIIGYILLILPGIIVAVVVSFVCLYMLFFMTDLKMPLFDAIKESYLITVKGGIGEQIVVLIIFMGLSAIGSSVFIGWLFTQPLATVFLASVYEESRIKAGQPSSVQAQ